MDKFIAKLFKDFEDGKMSRRQLIQTIKVAAITFAAGETAANAANPSTGFKTIAVNHISYSCPDYSIARDFYQHLMGMSVVQDSGRQCMMPFGAAGTHLLPRGYPAPPDGYTTSGAITAPPIQRGNRGGGGAAAAGGRGGAGSAAANAPQPPAERQARAPVTARVDHIAFTVKNWDKARAKAILEAWGLFPTEDSDSFHVRDPFGFDLQISGPGMTGFPAATNNGAGN